MPNGSPERTVYVMELRSLPNVPHENERLRKALKALLRGYGFRCEAIWEKSEPEKRRELMPAAK